MCFSSLYNLDGFECVRNVCVYLTWVKKTNYVLCWFCCCYYSEMSLLETQDFPSIHNRDADFRGSNYIHGFLVLIVWVVMALVTFYVFCWIWGSTKLQKSSWNLRNHKKNCTFIEIIAILLFTANYMIIFKDFQQWKHLPV